MSPFDVFQFALELPTPEEQDAFVERTCQGNEAVKAEVMSLLDAHRHSDGFLESRSQTGLTSQPATRSQSSSDRVFNLAVSIARLKKLLDPSPDPQAWGMLKHFSVLGILDVGGYGLVVRARDETLRRTIAIKLLDPARQLASEAQIQFLKEAQSAAQINHENVVRIYSVHPESIPFIVMEYVQGTTLSRYLESHKPLPIPTLLNFSRQIAAGLAAAHACGLVHRDVKPGNILVETMEETKEAPSMQVDVTGETRLRNTGDTPMLREYPCLKLTDFGLALGFEESISPSDSSDFIGTPSFASPEQARSIDIGPRSDLFSLGSVMYQMATGHAPFQAKSTAVLLGQVLHLHPRPIRDIRPEVPEWFCGLVEQLHKKAPEQRIQTATQVVRLIAQHESKSLSKPDASAIASDLSSTPSTIDPETHAYRRSRKSRASIGLAIGVTIAALTIAVAWQTANRFRKPAGNADSKLRPQDSTIAEALAKKPVRRIRSNHKLDLPDWNLPSQAPSPLTIPSSAENATKCQQAWADYLKQPVLSSTSIALNFALVPPGDFEKTFTRNRDGTIHPSMPRYRMRLTEPFRMATTEVTVEQFRAFVNETKYKTIAERIGFGCLKTAYTESELSWHSPGWPPRPTEPVTLVTEQDAIAFCEWLSKKENRRFRLPTEAEWIHACRAGSDSRFGFVDPSSSQTSSAWTKENSGLVPNPVAQSMANPIGIHDMLGNVWERTSDWLEHMAMLPYIHPINPKGVPISNTIGGCYVETLETTHADLIIGNWSTPSTTIGFRVIEELSNSNSNGDWEKQSLIPADGNPLSPGAFTTVPAKVPGLASWTLALPGPQSQKLQSPVWNNQFEHWFIGGDEGSVSVFNREGDFIEKLLGPSAATEVKVSPDGKWIAAKDSDGTHTQYLYLWHWPTRTLKSIFPTDGRFWNFAPDSTRLVFAKWNRGPWNNWGAYEFDLATGTTRNVVMSRWIDTFAWSPQSDRIICQTRVEQETMLEVLEYPSLQRIKSIPHHRVLQLAITADGKRLAVPDPEGKHIQIRSTEALEIVQTIEPTSDGKILSLQWYSDSDRLFVATTMSCCVVRASTGEVLSTLPLTESLSDAPRLIEEKQMIVGPKLSGGAFVRFDSETGQPLEEWKIKSQRTKGEFSVFLTENVAHFIVAGSIRSLDLRSNRIVKEERWLKGPWAWNPRSKAVVGIQDQNLVQFQLSTGVRTTVPAAWMGQWTPERLACSHDGRLIAAHAKDANGNAKILVVDSSLGNIVCELKSETNAMGALEFSTDNQTIGGLVKTGSVQLALWDSLSGELRTSSAVPVHPTLTPNIDLPVRFHAYENSVWVGAMDSVYRFDLAKQSWGIFPTPKLPLRDRSMVFRPSFQEWIISSGGRLHHLYDAKTQEYLGEITSSHAKPAWTEDGSWIGLNQTTGSMTLVDGESLALVGSLVPFLGDDGWMAFSPEGHYAGSESMDSSIVYLAIHEDGTHRTYDANEFARMFGWKNDLSAVRLLK